MKKVFAALIVLVLVITASACAETITVFNCYDYIDPEVITLFEEETAISVEYVNYTSNEEMYTKLEAGAGTYDVIFPSDYMVERLVKEDMLEELDFSAIPNFEGIREDLKNPVYDEGNRHSVPYMWGTLGILYNMDMVAEPITSWQALFDTANAGNVFMMNSIRDTIAIGLKTLGYSLNTRDENELAEAGALLVQQKTDGIVAGYILDEAKDKMVSNEAAIAIVYSGDALYAMDKNDRLAYVVPEEGSNIWVDGMCIPKGSEHVEAATQFINFLCREDVARMNLEYIRYSSPVQAVADSMSEADAANNALNPSDEVIARCEYFNDVSDCMDLYENVWFEIRMAR